MIVVALSLNFDAKDGDPEAWSVEVHDGKREIVNRYTASTAVACMLHVANWLRGQAPAELART
jgi:hypothetical protein